MALISFVLVSVVSMTLFVIAGVGYVQLTDRGQDMAVVLMYVAVALLLGGWAQTLNFLALREKEFRLTANAKILRAVTLSIAGVTGGFIRPAGATLMLADIIGKLAALILFLKKFWRQLAAHASGAALSRVLAAAKTYRRFPMVSLPGSMINTATFSITPVMVAAHFGLAVAGFYALVDRVLGAPSSLLGTAVGQVYMTELADLKRSSPGRARALFIRITVTQAKIALLPIILIAVIGPSLFALVFGEAWRDSGEFIRPLAVLYFLSFVVTPIGATLTVLEQQIRQFWWDTSRLISILAVWGAVGWFDLSPMTGLLVFASTMSVYFVAYLILCHSSLARLAHT